MKLLKVDTVNEVKNKLDKYFGKLEREVESVPLRSASGRYLAEDLTSDVDMPEFRRSVVDGYAVIAKDTFGVSDSIPVFLDVVGAVEMGNVCHITLKSGQAVYVPTGGMLPEGADAMVMIEFIEKLDEKTIAVYKPAAPNAMLMNQGDDFKKGELLYKKGHRITVKDIGMLAAIGKAEIRVYKRPKITIISTGDEIIDISKTPELGQIRDINSYTIAAFAEEAGAEIRTIIRVSDVYEDLAEAVTKALKESSIILLSGGSSAGHKDMTADIIHEMGEPGVITHGIAMKPGKPTIVGVVNPEQCSSQSERISPGTSALVVGLPGHPMAAIIAYDVIVNYFIKKYYFNNEEEPLVITARISENIHAGEGRETYQLVSLRKEFKKENQKQKEQSLEWIAEPIYAKSGSISQLMLADGYVRLDSLSEGIDANAKVEVILINR